MEFLLDCLTQHLCHEWAQERVICQLEHTKRNSISTCKQPCIILFLEHTKTKLQHAANKSRSTARAG